ncbi:HlyD family secretion protein [Calditerrivibrio nitroreducens]|uniref:Secretion protein HlyD family protein n=1 Tax=Calditerrivibrio nitroreducens (strain DSM 19672 / NBRC 101217 / Yu37-1) TaxID=768670 RepID=E4TFB8_CALNY|nr:efflux RND transporter periplasmic adaptor subunit [Calditerrivibrio nitroreducens]ADR18457.1 hypothetical protein Calni_0544 [Calditerrivibrio nitroreducens DSM 19672]
MKKILTLLFIVVLTISCTKNDNKIVISGRIEADEINLSFKYPGMIEEINFSEGDFILKDTILAKIKANDIKAQINRSKLEENTVSTALDAKYLQYQSALNRLEQLKIKKQFLNDSINNEILMAENNVKNADHKLKIDKINIQKAMANYEKVKNDYERFKVLYNENAIPKQKFDEIETLHKISKDDLSLAEESLKISEKNYLSAQNSLAISKARKKEIEAIEKEIKAAEKDIGIIKKEIDITSLNKLKTIEVTNELTSHMDDTTIKAPNNLIITRKFFQKGEIIAAGQSLAVGYNPEEIYFRGFIPEPLLGKIKLNMEGELKIDSYPDKSFKGKITFINSRSEFTPKDVQTPQERVKQVFLIKAKIDHNENILKPGMPADFIIKTE